MYNNSTIAAISTPYAAGGIGMIRVSGEASREIVGKFFEPVGERNLNNIKGYSAVYGRVYDEHGTIDEVVVILFIGPRSYTGEDVIEIICHGGLYILERILRVCVDSGAKLAEAGEFTKRAYINGKLELTQAEAVMDLISSQGEQSAKAALCAYNGVLAQKIEDMTQVLVKLSAHLAVWIDYPEDDISFEMDLKSQLEMLNKEMQTLLGTYQAAQTLKSGVETVIIGKPNVGKSTLMNLLSGTEKSIVTDVPGTTRDVVQESIQLGSVRLNLSDTAGIHSSEDKVEQIGIRLARRKLSEAALVLAVFDSSDILTKEDIHVLDELENRKSVAVINKSDLGRRIDIEYIQKKIKHIVYISAKSGDGKDELIKVIEDIYNISGFDPSAAVIANERQRKCVISAKTAVYEAIEAIAQGVTYDAITICIDEALDSLLSLSGKRTGETVVDEIFRSFCVGK